MRMMHKYISHQSWRGKTQLVLSTLAILMCLYSVGSIHQHEKGYYNLQSECVICDVESLLAHGAFASFAGIFVSAFLPFLYTASLNASKYLIVFMAFSARAPPQPS